MNSSPVIKSFLGTDTSYISRAPPFHTPRLGETIPKGRERKGETKKERVRGRRGGMRNKETGEKK